MLLGSGPHLDIAMCEVLGWTFTAPEMGHAGFMQARDPRGKRVTIQDNGRPTSYIHRSLSNDEDYTIPRYSISMEKAWSLTQGLGYHIYTKDALVFMRFTNRGADVFKDVSWESGNTIQLTICRARLRLAWKEEGDRNHAQYLVDVGAMSPEDYKRKYLGEWYPPETQI